ncbi:MAG: hypothetical protein ACRC33_11370 [Gemmataceae bacterium]
MPIVSVVFGLLLGGLGAYCYAVAEIDPVKGKSFTATIPAWPGVLLVVCGLVGMKESLLKHAMHAAATVGLLGFLAGAGQFARVALAGGDVTGNKGVASGGMAVLCLVFVGLCVNSFIQARRRRQAAAGA